MSAATWVIISLAMLVCGSNIRGENEFPVHTVALTVSVLQKHFNSGCVTLLQRMEGMNFGNTMFYA
jgi:hypothetical protein